MLCWGFNDQGSLGVPTADAGGLPSRAGVSGAPVFTGADRVIAGGGGGADTYNWTCAHRASDCTWWCWGNVPGVTPAPSDPWVPRALRWGP